MRFFIFLFVSLYFSFSLPALAACTNPGGDEGDIIYNGTYAVFQGCTEDGWIAFHTPLPEPPPAGCPNVGNICGDGTIYAGIFNGKKIYAAAADGPAGTSYRFGAHNFVTGEISTTDGRGNTDKLYAHITNGDGNANPDGTYPHNAILYCYDSTAHGRSDWYLPAKDELNFIQQQIGPSPNNNFQANFYWSSSEYNDIDSWTQWFSNGNQNHYSKASSYRVRCIRY